MATKYYSKGLAPLRADPRMEQCGHATGDGGEFVITGRNPPCLQGVQMNRSSIEHQGYLKMANNYPVRISRADCVLVIICRNASCRQDLRQTIFEIKHRDITPHVPHVPRCMQDHQTRPLHVPHVPHVPIACV